MLSRHARQRVVAAGSAWRAAYFSGADLFPVKTADEIASMIKDGDVVGFSAFTAAGAAKAVPRAIARKAVAEHKAGRPFKIGVVTGASTGPSIDGELARANAISFRTPYQSDKDLRNAINKGDVRFFDMHLSVLQQTVRAGLLGRMKWAVIEASSISSNGEIVPTTSVGASNTFAAEADWVVVELNKSFPRSMRGLHDIYEPRNPPNRREIPLYKARDRIGTPFIKVAPSKIVGVVRTNEPDAPTDFDPLTPVTERIGNNVAQFLANELKAGRIPPSFLPIQSGVGNVCNAVLSALGKHPEIPPFEMYSEVIQDSVFDLIDSGKCTFASGVAVTLSKATNDRLFANLEAYKKKLVLRPMEITNSPEIIRRLGLIGINTALEADLTGHVNSTHVLGTHIMNAIGGSADFTRSCSTSIFVCPSTAKGGAISAIVPAVSHTDHTEHSVQVLVTENGVADLRGKDPTERAHLVVENCAHPEYRPQLREYLALLKNKGHAVASLELEYAMHRKFKADGDMRGVKWQ